MVKQATPQEIVIPREHAVFWLDKHGRWCNRHGPFSHRKIIQYFHSCIKKDEQGYYLSQTRDGVREKVYFFYEDTALFVVDLIDDGDLLLVLNTGKKVKLKPRRLFVENDSLYMVWGQEIVKFSEHSLMKLSGRIEHRGHQYFIRIKNRRYTIAHGRDKH